MKKIFEKIHERISKQKYEDKNPYIYIYIYIILEFSNCRNIYNNNIKIKSFSDLTTLSDNQQNICDTPTSNERDRQYLLVDQMPSIYHVSCFYYCPSFRTFDFRLSFLCVICVSFLGALIYHLVSCVTHVAFN